MVSPGLVRVSVTAFRGRSNSSGLGLMGVGVAGNSAIMAVAMVAFQSGRDVAGESGDDGNSTKLHGFWGELLAFNEISKRRVGM